MGFANSSQGQGSEQGIPPLNAFTEIDNVTLLPPNAQGVSGFYDVHNYQSLILQVNDQRNGPSIGTPNYRQVIVDWFSEQNQTVPIYTEEFWLMDNNQVANPLITVLQPMTVEMPVRGWFMRVTISSSTNVPSIVSYSLIGQYRFIPYTVYSCKSGYFGVSGFTAVGSVEQRSVGLVGSKAGGTPAINDYPPTRSGPAHFHATVQTVTALAADLIILNPIQTIRIAGAMFPIANGIFEFDADIIVPNVPVQFQFASAASGYTFCSMNLTYLN